MKKRLPFLFFAVVLSALLHACKNNDNVFPKTLPAYINVLNASGDTLNFYLNGTRQNNASSLVPGGESFYQKVPAGAQNYQFKKAEGTSVLFSVPLTLKDSTNNSLYICGETASLSFNTVDFLDTSGVGSSAVYGKVRFVNASSNSGTLSVTVDDTSRFTQSPFKSTTVFLKLLSGTRTIKIYQAGATTPSVDTTVTIQAAHLYTLFSRGLINGKGSRAFSAGFAQNY